MTGEHRPGAGSGSVSAEAVASRVLATPSGRATQQDKPPVIMIHGGFSGPWAWEEFAERFRKAGYPVQVPALRFHDQAPPPSALATTSLADYADDLESLMATMKTPPILIGHSMGGLLAQMLATRQRIAAAILLAPSAPWGVPPSTLFEIGMAQSLMLRVGYWSAILEPNFDIAAAHSLDRCPKEQRDRLFQKFVPESGRATFEVLHWGLDMGRTSEVDVRKVQSPLLFLTGSVDRLSPPGTVKRTAALYRDRAHYEVVPGMSHWLIGEPSWEQVCDRALAWLQNIQ